MYGKRGRKTRNDVHNKFIWSQDIPPRGGDIQNPRSRNLLQPNKSTPTPERYKKGGFWLSAVETEFVVGLSSTWSLEHYSLSSSFTRPWHHGLALVLFFKLEMEMHMQKHL